MLKNQKNKQNKGLETRYRTKLNNLIFQFKNIIQMHNIKILLQNKKIMKITKMFSNLLEGNSNNGSNSRNTAQGSCGKLNGTPTKNPTNTARNSCNLGAVNGLDNNNNNG